MSERPEPRVIAGFGRSGTTWVQDVLATANSLRAVFEPLHPLWIRGAKAYAHRYLSASDDDQVFYRFLHRYFFDDFHSLWADYRVIWPRLYPHAVDLISWQRIKRVLRYGVHARDNILRFRSQRRHSQRIVKTVRANMLLAWIKANFNARIVFIIRHPVAVIVSQMRSPRAWNPQLSIERYRADSRLLDTLGDDSKRLLSMSLGDVEAHTLSWCIENAVALQQATDSNIPVIYYETLVRRGLPEWKRILSALALDVVPDERLILRPSQQAWGEKAMDAELVRQHSSWMEHTGQSTTMRIQKILDDTGVTVYHTREALPTNSELT